MKQLLANSMDWPAGDTLFVTRKRWNFRIAVRALLCALLLVHTAWAQPPAEGTQPPTGPRPSQPIEFVGPDTYILLDDQGRPQPVLGMSYEDFMAAWKQSQNLAEEDRQRRFVVEEITIDGRSVGGHAELDVEIAVRLLTDKQIEVPLGLAGAMLQTAPTGDSTAFNVTPAGAPTVDAAPSESYLQYDPAQGGFVAVLTGQSNQRHRLSLGVLVPLARRGTETVLRLNLPRALASSLSLGVDRPLAAATATHDAVLTQEETETGAQLNVTGLAGDFQLSWAEADAKRSQLSAVLSATGSILVSIDGRSVRTEALLEVRSYGGSFDRFRVRLPPDAKLIHDPSTDSSADAPGYRVSVEQSAQPGSPSDRATGVGSEVVLVEFDQPQSGPVEVSLSTEQPLGLDDGDRLVELAGFEVLGAVRQFGDLALSVADDWQLRWETPSHVRQVELSDLAPTLTQQPLTAAFQYDRQRWSLRAQVAPRTSRLHVATIYELGIEPDEARLRVHLTYQVFGARAFEFPIQLDDWQLTADAIESSGLVDRERVAPPEDGLLVLPLVQGSSRRAEITLSLRRDLPADSSRIVLPLPVPIAESTESSELLVSVAPELQLSPSLTESVGLTRIPTTPHDMAEADDRQTLRFRSSLPEAVLVADRTTRQRDAAATVTTNLHIGPVEHRVEQQFDLLIKYQPLAELIFEVPPDWSPTERPAEFVLVELATGPEQSPRETPLSITPVEDNAINSTDNLPQRWRVALPHPRLGPFRIAVRHTIDRPTDSPTVELLQVALVRPFDVRITDQQAFVRTARGLRFLLDSAGDDNPWQVLPLPPGTAASESVRQLVADSAARVLPLVVEAFEPDAPQATTVERVWLQTWLAGGVRQDRVAYRFHSTASRVRIELPPDVSSSEVELLLDSRPAVVDSRESGSLLVRLDVPAADSPLGIAAPVNRSHTLELRYRRPAEGQPLARRRFTPPQLVGRTSLGELYWQVILPSHLHMVRPPRQLASIGHWQWLGNFWGIRPSKTQPELEAWAGASERSAPDGQNVYLYSGLSPVSSIEIVTMPRWMIVLLASGGTLFLGLAWIYVPALQQRWVAIAMAVLVAVLAMAFPAGAVFVGQAGVLGVGLALVAGYLRRLSARPEPWTTVSTSSSMLHHPVPRSDSFIVMPSTGSTPTTKQTRHSDSQR